jgi:phosphatidylinositol glycan class T
VQGLPQVATSGVLIQLATPDIAMPYNVICLSSTVMAVFFGAALNAMLKRRN